MNIEQLCTDNSYNPVEKSIKTSKNHLSKVVDNFVKKVEGKSIKFSFYAQKISIQIELVFVANVMLSSCLDGLRFATLPI